MSEINLTRISFCTSFVISAINFSVKIIIFYTVQFTGATSRGYSDGYSRFWRDLAFKVVGLRDVRKKLRLT